MLILEQITSSLNRFQALALSMGPAGSEVIGGEVTTHVAAFLCLLPLWNRSSSDILAKKICWEATVAS